MTTMTDDVPNRLDRLEAKVDSLETGVQELRENVRELTGRVGALETAMQELRADLREMRSEHQADLRQVNARIDRVFYSVIGVGVAIVGALVALIIRIG